MVKYLDARQKGSTRPQAEQLCNVSEDMVNIAKKENSAFKNALMLVEAGVGCLMVTPDQLTRILEAQTTDARAAGFFGMTLEEFLDYVSKDPELKRVHETARLRGQAMIQRGIFDAAISGDPSILKFTGSSFLGMNEVQRVEISSKQIDDREIVRLLNSIMQAEEEKTLEQKTIDLVPAMIETKDSL